MVEQHFIRAFGNEGLRSNRERIVILEQARLDRLRAALEKSAAGVRVEVDVCNDLESATRVSPAPVTRKKSDFNRIVGVFGNDATIKASGKSVRIALHIGSSQRRINGALFGLSDAEYDD